MAETKNILSFITGTSDQFKGLESKNSNALYFLSDTNQIFKGETEYTKSAKIVDSKTSITSPEYGVIYVTKTEGAFVYTGTEFKALTVPYATSIPDSYSDNVDYDVIAPSVKAVKAYVDGKLSKSSIDSITYNTDSDGKLHILSSTESVPGTKDEIASVELKGVAHDPKYEAATRTITLPVIGGEDLVISLGKDTFVSSGKYNSKTHNIEITLNDGIYETDSSEDDNIKKGEDGQPIYSKQPTTILIPAGDLIDTYTGETSSTAKVTVSGENKITAEVLVSKNPDNKIQIAGDGLYVEPLVWTELA